MDKIEHTTVATNGINMHVASIGEGPETILFLHGFPELWYSWRHQMLALSARGYRCIAPDLRGFGGTDAPAPASQYSSLHVVGDLVGLLDVLGIERVFLVGHDWGANIAWDFCLLRPDRIRALVNTSVAYMPRNPRVKPIAGIREFLGDDFYICRFQEVGVSDDNFAPAGAEELIKSFYTHPTKEVQCFPKESGFSSLPEQASLPPWLSQEDVDYYASNFNRTGFTGGLNYYRALDLSWELKAAWDGAKVQVPTKFIVGDQDLAYHFPGVKDYIESGGMKKDVPNLEEVVVLEGVAHFLTQEKPDEVSQHIYDYIKKFNLARPANFKVAGEPLSK